MKRFLHLGVILPQPGQLRPDSSNSYGLDALVSNVNTYAVTLIDLSQSGTNITLTGQQALAGVVRLVGTASNNFTVTLPPTPRLIDALGPTVPRDGSYAVEISIQNEDTTFNATLTAGDSATTINGTSIVVAGTRRIWLMTVGTPYDYNVVSIQNIGTFSTTAISPTGGTVTSVGQTVPVEFTVSGSPVTSAGVLAIDKANETANTIWAGPTSGSAAQPTFRALVLADLPGGVGSGSVTSVGLTAPTEFTVSGSPVTTSGTLAITKATESANTVWAGPTTGAPAQPTFRSLVADDLPASLNLSQTFITQATEATLANSRVLTAGTNITITDGGPGSTITIASTSGGGGLLKSQYFGSSGSWTVPTGVTGAWVSGAGAGGGGSSFISAYGGPGGGSGEECVMQPITTNPGDVHTITIGVGGAGATAGGANAGGGNGGNTTFGTLVTILGGKGGATTNNGGAGGGPGGGAGGGSGAGSGTSGLSGTAESPTFFGGSGGGGNGTTLSGAAGAGYGGTAFGGAGGSVNSGQGGGGGGAASSRGIGGAGGNGGSAGVAATNPGSGGGGAGGITGSSLNGGAGANGWAAVFWIG